MTLVCLLYLVTKPNSLFCLYLSTQIDCINLFLDNSLISFNQFNKQLKFHNQNNKIEQAVYTFQKIIAVVERLISPPVVKSKNVCLNEITMPMLSVCNTFWPIKKESVYKFKLKQGHLLLLDTLVSINVCHSFYSV